jgi:MFS family permease
MQTIGSLIAGAFLDRFGVKGVCCQLLGLGLLLILSISNYMELLYLSKY